MPHHEKEHDMTVAEAGRKGGETTSKKYGHEFYEEIGHKGGEAGGPKGGHRVAELIEKGKEAEARLHTPEAKVYTKESKLEGGMHEGAGHKGGHRSAELIEKGKKST